MLDLNYWAQAYYLFLLLVARLGGFLVSAPFFGSRNIHPGLRFFCAVLLAMALVPLFPAENFPVPPGLLLFTWTLLKDLTLGLALGFGAGVVFSAFSVAGQILDFQIGFGMVNVFDPQSGAQVPLLGNLLYLMALVIFLSADGHHFLLQALWSSWQVIPPGGSWGGPALTLEIVRLVAVMFVGGVEIAAPVVAALFLADLALAVVARTIPQLNIFVVGLPLKATVGLALLALSLPAYGMVLRALLTEVEKSLEIFLSVLPPG